MPDGSGNKYAMALMIRNNIPFRMFRGEEEIVVTTEEVKFRDKEFSRILINGQTTSLTTDMGPQWDNWMGIREWVSNAIDEGGHSVVSCVEDVRPREGYTRIFIEHHDEIVKVINRWDRYFAFDRTDVLIECIGGKIFPQNDADEKTLYYRRGIQCYEPAGDKSQYCYDIPTLAINESRVIENTFSARCKVAELLLKHATRDVAATILYNSTREGYSENRIDWVYDSYSSAMNENWRKAIGDRIIINHDTSGFFTNLLSQPHYMVTKSMAKKIKNSFPDVEVYGIGKDGDEEVYQPYGEITKKMEYQLKKANEFLTDTKYPVTHEMQVVSFHKQDTLARAADNKILLSHKLFDMGIRQIVLAIMEEEEHLITRYKDETRELQNHLFNKWLGAVEEQYAIFL